MAAPCVDIPTLSLALLGASMASASAAPVAGRSLVAAPCLAPADANCAPAAALRFAPAVGVDADALHADVGVGWVAAGLVVRIEALPPDHQLEVTLSPAAPPGVDGGLPATSSVTLKTVGNSVVVVPAPAEAGEVRALRLLLVEDRTAAGPTAASPSDPPVVRAWAPTGPGDLHRPGWLLLAPGPPAATTAPGWDGSVLTATGARIDLRQLAPLRPASDRRTLAPWQTSATDRAVFPPLLGPAALTALIWQEEGGLVRSLSEWRLQAPAPELAAAGGVGVHPRPALIRASEGAPFRLRAGATIRLQEGLTPALATLVADECERLLGRRPSIGAGAAAPGDIAIGLRPAALPRRPWGDDVDAHLRATQGFAVAFADGRAQVWGADPLGALYGSLAMVDALAWAGPAGVGPLVFADHPDRLGRGLRLPLANADGPAVAADRRLQLLRRVVSRGRYDTLIVDATDGLRFVRRPELSRPGAASGEELRRFAAEAVALGLTLVPGLNLPSDDARWLTDRLPELAEDGYRRTACTRHPSWTPLVQDLLGELLDLVPGAAAAWIGQERLAWKTTNQFEDERCPRCQGAPHWWVGLEDAASTAQFLAQRGVGTWLSSDLTALTAGPENPALVRDTLRLAAAGDLTWLDTSHAGGDGSWEVAEGWRGPWSPGRRPVLLVSGSAAPWSGWSTGRATEEGASDHWARLLTAGAAAWTTRLDGASPDAILAAAAPLPAFRPGAARPPGQALQSLVAGAGAATGAGLPLLAGAVRVTAGAPLSVALGAPVEGVGLLAAVSLDRTATAAVRALRGRDGSADGPAIAVLELRRAGTGSERVMLRLGVDIELATGPLTCQFPWSAVGRWTAASPGGAAPPATYSRRDVWLRQDAGPVERLELRVLAPGAEVQLMALAALEAADVD